MTTAAVLPVKRFENAKQRLSIGLAREDRRALAEAMVADVLDALARCRQIEHVIVVSSDACAQKLARAAGAEVLGDPEQAGHNPAVRRGVRRATERGHRDVLLVPGDCPAVGPADLDELVDAVPVGTSSVVGVPDRHGAGTNALLLSPAELIEPSFGPGSFARHRRAARQAQARWLVRRPWPLLFDVDTVGDLQALGGVLEREPAAARRTRELLARPAPSVSRS